MRIVWLFQTQVLQDLLNNIWVFNRCDDSNGSTALFTFPNSYGEHTLEPLRPGHRIGLRFRVLWFFHRFLRNNVFTQFAIGRKAAPREHPMKTREVHSWPWHKCSQATHEFHWTEHDMSGAIVVRRLQRNDDIAVVGQ